MKNLNLYALANELNIGDPKSGAIRVPFGRWDFGAKKLDVAIRLIIKGSGNNKPKIVS